MVEKIVIQHAGDNKLRPIRPHRQDKQDGGHVTSTNSLYGKEIKLSLLKRLIKSLFTKREPIVYQAKITITGITTVKVVIVEEVRLTGIDELEIE